MTFYTGKPVDDIPIQIEPTVNQVLLAELAEGFNNSLLVSWGRESKLDKLNVDKSAGFSDKNQADSLLSKYGIDYVTVPSSGLSKLFVDEVINYRINEVYRETLISNPPDVFGIKALMLASKVAGSTTTWIVMVAALIFAIKITRRR